MEIARTVAARLLATEEAIDNAIVCAAALVGYMPVARLGANVSTAVGQPAFKQVIATMSMLAEARSQMVEAHKSLAESGRQANIPSRNFGGFVDKPSQQPHAELQIVTESKAA
ncbi:hypothetical protein [Sandarakinorhabdus sp.]|uniref:hypothetical protein n=1 Tax=Sandarakinorhabdus sp. TaxID=1916663 RepID=UPI00286E7395|nr:hypothetical protein [Sandarakinorhabdus sp.]